MKAVNRDVVAGLAGSAAAAGAVFGLSFSLIAAGVTGGLLYLGVKYIIPRTPDDDEVTVAPGVTLERAKQLLDDGFAQAERFREVASRVRDKKIQAKVEEMAQVIEDLFKNFEKEPAILISLHGFLTDHLNRAYEIISGYAKLSAMPHLDTATLRKMSSTVRTIDEIADAIKGQYLHIVSEKVAALETAGKVFQSIMDVEGRSASDVDLTQ
jgi:hypothetical protein